MHISFVLTMMRSIHRSRTRSPSQEEFEDAINGIIARASTGCQLEKPKVVPGDTKCDGHPIRDCCRARVPSGGCLSKKISMLGYRIGDPRKLGSRADRV